MADFDETEIRSPRQAADTIRPGDVAPWMVWCVAGALAALALLGLFLGMRGGHPASGVTLTLARGELINPAAAASAAPATPMPKDPDWSVLSGPEIRPKVQPPTRTATAEEDDSDEAASDETAAAAAADDMDQGPAEPASPAAQPPAAPPAAPTPAPTPATGSPAPDDQ